MCEILIPGKPVWPLEKST